MLPPPPLPPFPHPSATFPSALAWITDAVRNVGAGHMIDKAVYLECTPEVLDLSGSKAIQISGNPAEVTYEP